MTIEQLVGELRSRSIQLRRVGNELDVYGDPEVLDPPFVELLRRHKEALLLLVGENGAKGPAPTILCPSGSLTQEEIDRIAATVPGGADNVQDIYPLTPLQEGIFFHYLLAKEGDAYLHPYLLAFNTRGRLDGFVQAMQAVVDRHDILRSSIAWEQLAEPVQVVWRRAPLAIEEVAVNPGDDAVAILKARFNPRRYRIEVREAPLLRLGIARDEAKDRWLLLILLHHLVGDHTTMDVMQEEIQAHLLGRAEQLPRPSPFRNLVARARQGVNAQEHEQFFREMLGAVDEPTAPFGLMDTRGDGGGITEARLPVDPELAKRLRERARRLGVNAAALFHQAWAQVLARLSGREEVVFGTVFFGRMQGEEGAERGIGMYINTLPVKLRVGEAGAAQSVKDTHALLTELMRHEHASLALAQRCSGVRPPLPLFTSLLNCRHSGNAKYDRSARGMEAWEGIQRVWSEERTNYPLMLSVDDFGERFALAAQTDASIEPMRMCEMMHTALERLVGALENTPQVPIRSVEVLPKAEWRRMVEQWNATDAAYPDHACVHELFEAQVRRTPEAVAVACEDRVITYRELNERANRLAHHLQAMGAGPDRRVALCVHRRIEMVIGLLAILKAGGAYVPLDPTYPAERLRQILADSGPVALLTQEAVWRELKLDGTIRGLPVVELGQARADQPHTNLAAADLGLNPTHLAYVIYTSGSTGTPKGVMIEHRNVVSFLSWAKTAFRAEDLARTLGSTSINFDLAVYELYLPLLIGGTVVLVQDVLRLAQPGAKVTSVNTVPSAMRALVDLGHVPETVKVVNLAGEVLKQELVERIWAASKVERICNLYGPSETTTYSTWISMDRHEGFPATIGRPIANTRVYILDRHRQPAPIGVTGELYIAGAGVARGYLNRPELTAERFGPDPFSGKAGARMYRTGDLGRWRPDGTIEFLGRNDHQVKIRGFRIEPGEIEARLLEHPGVREAVVLARDDSGDEKRLVAYVTAQAEVTAEDLRADLSTHLPAHMVPVAFVKLPMLPLTPNGKLDRQALPAPEGDAYVTRAYEPPEGEVEAKLAMIWAELLRVDRVGRHDNFFELGGHSLLAITLIERMRRQGIQSDVRSLFAAPTLCRLAAAASTASGKVQVPANLIPIGARGITPEMLPLVKLTAAEIERITAAVPGGTANVQDIYPLAPLQEGILFHHLMAKKGDAYVLSSLLAFDTRERLTRFIAAMQAVVDRYDILRTAIAWEQVVEPVQVVWRKAPLAVEEVALGPGDAARQLRERFDPRHHRIDVRQAPLLRLCIGRDEANGRWLLLILLHHLAGDHTTLEVMREEIHAHLSGRAAELPVPVPFRVLVAQARAGIRAQEHEQFFREMLGSVDEPTAPFDLMDVRRDGGGIQQAWLAVDPGLSRRLRERARRLEVSVASLAHQAWAQVLARLTGKREVVFGTVLFGRLQGGEGAERGIGLFINTLPIKLNADEIGTTQGVKQTHELLTRLMRHEHASLALAQRCSRVPASVPLFTTLLNYRYGGAQASSSKTVPGWQGMQLLFADERTNYPLTLSVNDAGEGFSLTVQADASIEAMRVCEMTHAAFERLTEALENNPLVPIHSLDILPKPERQLVLEQWNATEAAYSEQTCLHELFEAQAARTPEAVALVDGDRIFRYRELNARANRLAHRLRAAGVKPDTRVAICAERSMEMIAGLLAVLKAGGAYVPLDATYPLERLQQMLADSAPVVLLTTASLPRGLDLSGHMPGMAIMDLNLSFPGERETNLAVADIGLRPDHLAYVIYTSGSTGRPKGVMVEHRGVCNLVEAQIPCFCLTPDSRVLQFASFSFDACVSEVFTTLCRGAALCLLPEGAKAGEPLARTIAAQGITHVTLPPVLLATLENPAGLTSLRTLVVAGEAPAEDVVRRWLPGRRVINAYGPTEATVCVAMYDCRPDEPGRIPIGRPMANTRIYILDRRGAPAPVGITGELYIGGAGVARGYLNRPELTAERFLPDPFIGKSGARIYKTGDLGRWRPDGTIEFLGRNDHQVKIRGFRIELGEIETHLQDYPGVRDVAVIAREDGLGERRLVAYLTGETAAPAEGLRRHLSTHLPEYMVPAAFVHLEQLPLTPSGKLDRKALPMPETAAYATRAYEAPASEMEIKVAAIWSELLRVERVGRHDNFFELGGHSLLSMQLGSRLQRQLQVEVPVRDIYSRPVLADFAAGLTTAPRTPLPPVSRAERNGRIPLSFAQRRLWFLAQMKGVSEAYHIPGGIRLKGSLNRSALRRALDRIVARHEALRTTFRLENGEPAQQIMPAEASSFSLVEQRAQAGSELERWMLAEATAPFDLEQGPLVRGRLIQEAEEMHVLSVTMHHIVSDGWSMGILVNEFSALYAAYARGDADPLPELPVQYADYAIWQRQWMSGKRLEDQTRYWQKTLAGAPDLLELPTDHPRPAQQSHAAATVAFELDEALTRELTELGLRHGATLFMTLLAGWAALLARLSNQEDVVIGTPSANRDQREVEGLIGFFINMLAVRVDLSDGPGVAELLRRVKDRVLEAQSNQDIPFEQVVELVKPTRSSAHSPLFQVVFSWQNQNGSSLRLPGLTLQSLKMTTSMTTKFDLTFLLQGTKGRVSGRLLYATALFEPSTVERMLGYYRTLLEGMVADE